NKIHDPSDWVFSSLALTIAQQSGRDVAAVQMRLDSVDVLTSRSRGLIVVAMAWLLGAGSMAYGADIDPLKLPDTQLEPVEWADLNGWSADDHAVAFATFLASCKPFLNSGQPRDPKPIYEGLLHACRRAAAAKIAGAAEARKFFEENFRPVRIARLGSVALKNCDFRRGLSCL